MTNIPMLINIYLASYLSPGIAASGDTFSCILGYHLVDSMLAGCQILMHLSHGRLGSTFNAVLWVKNADQCPERIHP